MLKKNMSNLKQWLIKPTSTPEVKNYHYFILIGVALFISLFDSIMNYLFPLVN